MPPPPPAKLLRLSSREAPESDPSTPKHMPGYVSPILDLPEPVPESSPPRKGKSCRVSTIPVLPSVTSADSPGSESPWESAPVSDVQLLPEEIKPSRAEQEASCRVHSPVESYLEICPLLTEEENLTATTDLLIFFIRTLKFITRA